MMKHFSKNQSLLQALFRMLPVLFAICLLALTGVVRANDLNLSFALTEVKGQIDDGKNTTKSARCLIVFSNAAKVGYKNAFCRYDNEKRDDDNGNITPMRKFEQTAIQNNIQTWLGVVIDEVQTPSTTTGKKWTMNQEDGWTKFSSEVENYLNQSVKSAVQTPQTFSFSASAKETIRITLTHQTQLVVPDLTEQPKIDENQFAILVHQSIVYHFRKRKVDNIELPNESETKTTEDKSSPPWPGKSINDEIKEVKKEIQKVSKVSEEVQMELKNIQNKLQEIDRGKIFSLPAVPFLAVMLAVIFLAVIISSWMLKRAIVGELSRQIDNQSGAVTDQIAKTVSLEKLFSSLSGKLENILGQKLDEVVKEVSSETKLIQQLKPIDGLLRSVEKSIKGVKDPKWWEDNLPTLKKGVEITEISLLNKELTKTQESNRQLQEDLTGKENALATMTGERDGLKGELKTAKAECSQMDENLQKEKARFEELEKQLAKSKGRENNLQAQLNTEQQLHSETKEFHKKEMRTFEEKVEALLRERFCLLKSKEVNFDDWMEQLKQQKGIWQWLQVMLAVTLSKCEKVNKEMALQEKTPTSKPGKVLKVIELNKLLSGCRTLTTGAFTSDNELKEKLTGLDNGEWLQCLLRADALFSTYFGDDDYQSLKPLFADLSLMSNLLETVLRTQGVEFYKPSLLESEPNWGSQVKIVTDTSSLSHEFKELVKQQVKQQVKQRDTMTGEDKSMVAEGKMIVWVSKYGIKEKQSSGPAEVRVIKHNYSDWQ